MSPSLTTWGRRTLPDFFLENARVFPERPFLCAAGAEFSYKNVNAASVELARMLRGAGVEAGSRVAIVMSNRPAFLVAFLAIMRLGATIVPLNTAYKADEFHYALEHSSCSAVVTEVSFEDTLKSVCSRLPRLAALFLGREEEPLLFSVSGGNRPSLSSLPDETQTCPEDVAGIFYTSGTTARPKGVMITHRNLVYSAEVTVRSLALNAEDVPALAFPLFHANSLFYGVLSSILLGGTIGLLPGFSLSRYWKQISDTGATWTPGITGPLMRLLLRQEKSEEESRLRMRFAVGGTFLNLEEITEFTSRFGVRLIPGWSMTETVSLGTLHPIHRDVAIPGVTAIGYPTLGQEVRIVREDGSEAASGETGEILFRSPSMFAGYLNDPESTRLAFTSDGWLRSGDLARMDETGYLSFVDRKKDMIKTRGENVAAAEVERVLNEHPGVVESAVIGVRSEDGLLGEQVEAYVVRNERSLPVVEGDVLQRWTAERLADFKVPRIIHFVAAIPKTPLGKIQRQELRKTKTSTTPDNIGR